MRAGGDESSCCLVIDNVVDYSFSRLAQTFTVASWTSLCSILSRFCCPHYGTKIDGWAPSNKKIGTSMSVNQFSWKCLKITLNIVS
jgi:hypothetical protein